MKVYDVEKTLLCHLLACDVPESAIRIVRAENSDYVTVSVTGECSTITRRYFTFEFLNDDIVEEMRAFADFYHFGRYK